MYQNNVKLVPIENELDGEFAEIVGYNCDICDKFTLFYPPQRKMCEKLSRNNFYCNFCLQNNFNNRAVKRDLLILSFRSIIGFYYLNYYTSKKIYYSQIESMIQSHEKTGLIYPFMKYDPETFLWFVDFSKIGRGQKKISVDELIAATINITSCFNLPIVIDGFKTQVFIQKFIDAIDKFYSNRYRPEDKKFLVPTLLNCVNTTDQKMVENTSYKNFTKMNFIMR